MGFKYALLDRSKVNRETALIANQAVKVFAGVLGTAQVPLHFICEDRLGEIERPHRIRGFTQHSPLGIYILRDQPLSEIVSIIIHEMTHVWQLRNGATRRIESRALFNERRLWRMRDPGNSFAQVSLELSRIDAEEILRDRYRERIHERNAFFVGHKRAAGLPSGYEISGLFQAALKVSR